MWELFGNIFGTIRGSDVIKRMDDWKLSEEETIKYQLEWMKTLPTGFQLAQRFIGIAFSIVFLIMVLTSFILLAVGLEIEHLIDYISITMSKPIMIIFSLFFGGGLINSFRGVTKTAPQKTASSPTLQTDIFKYEPSRKEVRQSKRKARGNG